MIGGDPPNGRSCKYDNQRAIIEPINKRTHVLKRWRCVMRTKVDEPDERETEKQFLDWVSLLQAIKEK